MQPIDRSFRFTVDFCVVWALLAVPVFILTRRSDWGPWYSFAGILILLPLFATFALYGPILLMRQVISSGSRGRFVLQTFLSIVLVAALLLVGLYFSGYYSEDRARMLAFLFTAMATAYLNWRLEK
jgi:hypothetical protein